ncbi:uncharacterized protein [Nicotiana sylvestris]|uniref:uncharacterized protein n=1 Tax=Nicotiana sylvestris TaxID=4096 RepID=UPI00388CC0C1
MVAIEMLKNGFVPGKGLGASLQVHKLPTDPAFPPVKQKLRKFKTDVSVKIKEEVTKQFDAKVIRFTGYPTWTAMKAQALANHLAENPLDEEYEPLKTYFPDEEVMHIDKLEQVGETGWKRFFDGAVNMKGIGIGAVLISEIGHHYPVTAQLRFYCTNNMTEYEACILGLRQCLHDLCQRFRSVDFRHIPRIHNKVADDLATLASMLHHPDKAYVDPLHIQVHGQHVYCNVVEEKLDGEPWFHDIRGYIRMGVYPVQATGDQQRTIRRLASGFFFSGGVLYKRTPDLDY